MSTKKYAPGEESRHLTQLCAFAAEVTPQELSQNKRECNPPPKDQDLLAYEYALTS